MFRFTIPALVALAALAIAPGAFAAPPTVEELNPPPPDFLTCKPTGAGTICSGSFQEVKVSEPQPDLVCGSGAEAFVNTNTPERALRQVVREASAFYLLGYSSGRNPQDGKFHKIGVKVKRPGIDVRARRGYWAPNATDLEHARSEAATANAIPADVTNAVAILSTARAERLVDVSVGAERGADGQPSVTVAWTLRPGVGRQDPARTVTLAVKGAGGDRSFDAGLGDGALSFPSPPERTISSSVRINGEKPSA